MKKKSIEWLVQEAELRQKANEIKAWLVQEAELKREANEILAQSKALMKTADRTMEIINKFNEDYPDHLIENMQWDEKEKIVEIGMSLMKKLNKNTTSLLELDKEYDVLRQKVNEFYGKEIMKKSESLKPWIEEDIEEDNANWWKKS